MLGHQMQGGLGTPGVLSHACVQHPPLRCDIPDIQGLFYDDANKFLIAPTADRILYWKITPSAPAGPPNSDPVNEGPLLSVRYSLDQKATGIQRSRHKIESRNRETGETCIKKCRADSETILGFFWTDCPTCDVILVKTSGLDLLAYEPQSNALRMVNSKKFNVSWYLYTHESRMILLASGMQCTIFTGYQILEPSKELAVQTHGAGSAALAHKKVGHGHAEGVWPAPRLCHRITAGRVLPGGYYRASCAVTWRKPWRRTAPRAWSLC